MRSLLKVCKCLVRPLCIKSTLSLSLQTKEETPRRENFDWSVLKSNQDLQHRYSTQLDNRSSILQNDLTDTIDDKYQHFITVNKETVKDS